MMKMPFADFRGEAAVSLGQTDGTLKAYQQAMQRNPELRGIGMRQNTGQTKRRRGPPPPWDVTYISSALLVLAAMCGQDRDTIDQRVLALWHSPPVSRTGNPLEKCESLGVCLTLILRRADIRARLGYCQLDRTVPEFMFVFDRGSQLIFAPFASTHEYRQRVIELAGTEPLAKIFRLPAISLTKVSALVEQPGGSA